MKKLILAFCLIAGLVFAQGPNKTPIYNGILQTDLDANGHNIIGINITLPTDVTRQGNMFNGASGLMQLDGAGVAFVANLPTLDLLRAPVGNLSLAGKRLVNLGSPVDPTDAASKSYVDASAAGQQTLAPVAAASTGVLILSGVQTVDGITGAGGSRILVKDQIDPTQNGIYAMASGTW